MIECSLENTIGVNLNLISKLIVVECPMISLLVLEVDALKEGIKRDISINLHLLHCSPIAFLHLTQYPALFEIREEMKVIIVV
jgi:hypothetical protein